MYKIVVAALLLSFTACTTKTPEAEKSYFCNPQLEAFFSGPDSLPVVKFNYKNSFEELEKQLKPLLDSAGLGIVNFKIEM